MRLLLLNPNTTNSMTQTMAAIARKIAGDRAEIVSITANRGFPYIASRAEAQIAGGIVLEMIAEHLSGIDAVIIAAFGDPGLAAARELFDIPVIGMAEAAILCASMLGERFALVTFSPLMVPWYRDCLTSSGRGGSCTGILTPPLRDLNLGQIAADNRADLIALAHKAAVKDGAEVIILAGAPLAGMAEDIASEVPALLIDPIAAATAQAMAMVSIVGPANTTRRASKPPGKASTGLSRHLELAMGVK